jgi:hypothetical protein
MISVTEDLNDSRPAKSRPNPKTPKTQDVLCQNRIYEDKRMAESTVYWEFGAKPVA